LKPRTADEAKLGRPWSDDELDAIVADYFVMLEAELAGRRYVKSHHSAALMAQIGRTHRSVEFKHQNISAVLDELGMPWISGYMPKRNYQNAIFGAIDRYLSAHPAVLEPHAALSPIAPPPHEIFVAPPKLDPDPAPMPEGLRRLLRKFDPAQRDLRNRSLGQAGEALVVEIERRQLCAAERSDLAGNVKWIAADEGDGAGYDVLSFTRSGSPRLIEVKTTNGSARTPFFLTRNECAVASERPSEWQIYRVYEFAKAPRIFTVSPPLENSVRLRTETWQASFR
jgi:hypothetical protein